MGRCFSARNYFERKHTIVKIIFNRKKRENGLYKIVNNEPSSILQIFLILVSSHLFGESDWILQN